MNKVDMKMQWKALYDAKAEVTAVDVPLLTYLMVDGEGDPYTAKSFPEAFEALFALSYTLKFTLKNSSGAIDFSVMPLEALWWADDPRAFQEGNKSAWKWTVMIMQPRFIAQEEVDVAFEKVRRKKNSAALDQVRFETFTEGLSAQVLHVGPFADEGPTIQRMHDFIRAAGKELRGKHHEIYLCDPRRTAPEKLKTILRQPMR
jgi:hypothetical protein